MNDWDATVYDPLLPGLPADGPRGSWRVSAGPAGLTYAADDVVDRYVNVFFRI